VKTRHATVTDIVPNEGRMIGYVVVMDDHMSTHHFNNGSLNGAQKLDLNIGDNVVIAYTSGPGYGCWSITEKG